MKNKIIFLNGTSSSGKTALAEAFQVVMHEPTLYASVDKFIFMLGQHILDDDSVRPQSLPPVLSAFHKSLLNLARCGFPMIVDYVLEKRAWLEECVEELTDHTVYFVCVLPGRCAGRTRTRAGRQEGGVCPVAVQSRAHVWELRFGDRYLKADSGGGSGTA